MGARSGLTVPLSRAWDVPETSVGGKAHTLGHLIKADYPVPRGFCIQVEAYEQFVASTGLRATIGYEVGRKNLADMRWEEIWDAALRIRAAFMHEPFPSEIAGPILLAYEELAAETLAVRSSAPGEDSTDRSFAGLHESVVGITDAKGLLDAVRMVWASLWSDAALLYRQELDLDVKSSRMAVVVQEFIAAEVSGVGFGLDPLNPGEDREIIEAVPGFCEGLVSGEVDPDRWVLKRSTGELVQWKPGNREVAADDPVLGEADLRGVHETLRSVQRHLGYEPDVEWTGRAPDLTLLQARPVTVGGDDNEERQWYLNLRPGDGALHALCARVSEELIPALREEGIRLGADDLTGLGDTALADALQVRHEAHERWKKIYRDEFIPFAHGVRRLGMYYNDAVRPADPYEFVGLVENQKMLATERNRALMDLARLLAEDGQLASGLQALIQAGDLNSREAWLNRAADLEDSPRRDVFCQGFDSFLADFLNLTYDGESMDNRPDLVLNILLQLDPGTEPGDGENSQQTGLEEKLLEAVGPEHRVEAQEMLRVGRLSWQLCDDDNILMGSLQNQLQQALDLAGQHLQTAGRLPAGTKLKGKNVEAILEALRDPDGGNVTLPEAPAPAATPRARPDGERPRQLIGQPAARGLATGQVRVVKGPADFRDFQRGEIMVCDAIQPTMTHLVTLAGAIVERRGGMLIHGAIIARELGVPCVNGVPDATRLLENGDFVTVDGHLGIVTVGEPEFDLEVAE